MTKPRFSLRVYAPDGVPVETASNNVTELAMIEQANSIIKALGILRFRGSVVLDVCDNGRSLWGATVTFTDDLPHGIWSVTESLDRAKH